MVVGGVSGAVAHPTLSVAGSSGGSPVIQFGAYVWVARYLAASPGCRVTRRCAVTPRVALAPVPLCRLADTKQRRAEKPLHWLYAFKRGVGPR